MNPTPALTDRLYQHFFQDAYACLSSAAGTSGRLVQFVRAGTEHEPRGDRGFPQGMNVNSVAISLATVVADWKTLASLADLAAWKRGKGDEPGAKKAAELIERVVPFADAAARHCTGPTIPREMHPALRDEALRLGEWALVAMPDHFG